MRQIERQMISPPEGCPDPVSVFIMPDTSLLFNRTSLGESVLHLSRLGEYSPGLGRLHKKCNLGQITNCVF